MAGILKSVLAIEHGTVPASLHLTEPNPAVPWSELPFDVPRETVPWPDDGQPRLAGVSAFGITGTNAHIVLEQAPKTNPPPTSAVAGVWPLPISAATPEALRATAAAFADALEGQPELSLADVCATSARHRAALDQRAVFAVSDRAVAVERLRRFAADDPTAADSSGSATGGAARRIAFIFSGQGGQWLGMARELLEHEPRFRESIANIDAALPEDVGFKVLEQLKADPGSAAYRLDEIGVIQPTLLAVEMALAELWRAYGVTPDAVIGHSVGEAGAAYFAGVLSLRDAMRVICGRSALMQRTSGKGGMALVGLGLDETRARIGSRSDVVSVAASNGPRSTIISGDPAAIATILAELEPEGVFCRTVQVDVASHSPQMEPLVPELVAKLAGLTAHAGRIALYSTVYSRRVEGTECNAEYWGKNLRQPVLFGPTAEHLLADGIDTFIEVGPHPTLLASVAEAKPAERPLTLPSLRRNEPEQATLMASLGALWVAGHPVTWANIFPSGKYARVRLPHYSWQRERHWSSAALGALARRLHRRLAREVARRLAGGEWAFARRGAARAERLGGRRRHAGRSSGVARKTRAGRLARARNRVLRKREGCDPCASRRHRSPARPRCRSVGGEPGDAPSLLGHFGRPARTR
jgi:myxalamid-type polyketide synthase MxaE and MxaD